MFRLLTRTIRREAAGVLASLNFACVIAPAVLVAMLSFAAAHPLGGAHAPPKMIHNQEADSGHRHAHPAHAISAEKHESDSEQGEHVGCCGVFCLSAIADAHGPDLDPSAPCSEVFAHPDTARKGRLPKALHRPPIAPASL